MKITKELRALSPEELDQRLKELKKELLVLKAGASSGVNAPNPGKFRQAKKNVARILTILGNKRGDK